MNDEVPFLQPWVKRLVIPKGNVGNRHIIKTIGQTGFLEWLVADVRIRVECFCQPGRDGINFDGRHLGTLVHFVRHQADEMSQAASGFQNASLLKPETLKRVIHRPDDQRCGVMGVESAGAGRFQFFGGQQFLQPLALFGPFLVQGIKDLGQSAPANISDESALFFVRGGSCLCFEAFEQFDRREIVAAFLPERADANSCRASVMR